MCTFVYNCIILFLFVYSTFILPAEKDESGKGISDHDSLWLECDDDKLKVVTAGEVSHMMHTTTITPYLLFYSRL